MRKIVVLAIVLAFVVSAVPAFAGGSNKACQPCGEKSIFQIVKDTIDKPGAPKTKVAAAPAGKSFFQSVSDGIEEGSAKAKLESLRNKPATK